MAEKKFTGPSGSGAHSSGWGVGGARSYFKEEPPPEEIFSLWARMDLWRWRDLARLLLALDPNQYTAWRKDVFDIETLAQASIQARTLLPQFSPLDGLAWAKQKQIPVPPLLEKLVAEFHRLPPAETSDGRRVRLWNQRCEMNKRGEKHIVSTLAAQEGVGSSMMTRLLREGKKLVTRDAQAAKPR